MSLDVTSALRTAILADPVLSGLLGETSGEPSVFTRRPAPDGAQYPMVMIAQVGVEDADFVNTSLPVVTVDVAVYGLQREEYRVAVEIGYTLRRKFHRKRAALAVSGCRVIQIRARGPFVAPTDDEKTTGRVVSLTIQLQELPA